MDFFQAMETFLGLAEDFMGETYTQIVNLDTAFYAMFWSAFFYRDAGEPLAGNYLFASIQTLMKGWRSSYKADYVKCASHLWC